MSGVDRDGLLEVTIVFNGALEMSPGKMAGQALQAGMRHLLQTSEAEEEWLATGTRTIVRTALTTTIFERVCAEAVGHVMRDEGYTEVPVDSATCFISIPYRHRDRPKIFNNKKVPLL